LMSALFNLTDKVVMQFKHHFRVRRPADHSPLVQPILQTPNHSSYPAGHSTQCFFVANVLKALLKNGAGVYPQGPDIVNQLDKLAQRISDNRVVAGVHFPEDMAKGADLGNQLAQYFIYMATKPLVAGTDATAVQWLWGKARAEWI